MTEGDLLTVYRDYLRCLNERRWEDLGRFVAVSLVYNGTELGLDGYRAMLERDALAIPDLQFTPQILVADHHFVSCRLFFECTPQQPFLGLEPTGRRVSFPEHVFYRFEGGRIVEVWSLIDTDTIRAQYARYP